MKIIISLLFILTPSISYSTEFEVGQIWKYKTLSPESESTITILKIEKFNDLGKVVHIRVNNLNLVNPIKRRKASALPYAPFTQNAIENSVTKLVGKLETIPDFSVGYQYWRVEYDAGKIGAFDISVKDALRTMFEEDWVEKE